MKEKTVSIIQTPVYNPINQCFGKKQYKLRRRAMVDAHGLAENNPEDVFTVYECPHCHKYHIGRVRKE
jgi:hypothetical protein